MKSVSPYFLSKGCRCSYLSVDELDVLGALRVAVSGSVLSTGLVASVLGLSTIGVHGDKVQSAVQTAREPRNISVEGELLVLQVEELVLLVGLVHEVDTGSNVRASDELEVDRVAAGGDTVGTRVVSTVKGAVGCASGTVWAVLSVPCLAGVAVGVATSIVDPTPVAVEHNGVLLGSAARSSALLGGDLRVVLGGGGTCLLAIGLSEEGEDGDLDRLTHCGGQLCLWMS